MSEYIGNQPATSFETVQKQISTSNSGTTITLDRAVTSVQDILLTIDAVVQSYDNYSVSGTTLTVGGTLNNNRVEILFVGRTMQSVDPTDSSVSTAKIQNDAVTVDKLNLISTSSVPSLEAKGDGSSQDGYIQLNCSQNSHGIKIKSAPHSANASYTLTLPNNDGNANQFLQTNGSGVLSFADAGGGITMCDTYALNSSFSGNAEPIASNLSRLSSGTYGTIGTGMTESSGVFTFPSTGIYLVEAQWSWYLNNSSKWIEGSIQAITSGTDFNNSSRSTAYASISRVDSDVTYANASTSMVCDVTNTTDYKVRMISTANNTSTTTTGESNRMITGIRFTRLGDT